MLYPHNPQHPRIDIVRIDTDVTSLVDDEPTPGKPRLHLVKPTGLTQ